MASTDKRYDVKITLHSIVNLPVADITTLSADPYLYLTLYDPKGGDDDYNITFRSPTHHRTLHPTFPPHTFWIVANIPASGFTLLVDAKDEDPANQDDGLGRQKLHFDNIGEVGWKQEHHKFELHRRGGGSWRAYACAPIMKQIVRDKDAEGLSGDRPVVDISVEVLRETENQEVRNNNVYTLGPSYFSKHFSKLFGRLAGIKEKIKPDQVDDDENQPGDASRTKQEVQTSHKGPRYNFQSNIMQLPGPVPPELYHAFVPSKLFIKKLFTGVLLPHALHTHHRKIFSHDQTTVYGVVLDEPPSKDDTIDEKDNPKVKTNPPDTGVDDDHRPDDEAQYEEHEMNNPTTTTRQTKSNPSLALTDRFLEMCGELHESGKLAKEVESEGEESADTGGCLFTYVLLPDAQLRWAEVGFGWAKEVGSKHVVLANGMRHVAFAGEFFIRRKPTHAQNQYQTEDESQQTDKHGKAKPAFQLVIDNASGTYRPPAKHLDTFRKYLTKTFEGLDILVMDGTGDDAKKLEKMKENHLKKGRERGDVTGDVNGGIRDGDMDTSSSSSSSSSSDAGSTHEHVGTRNTNHHPTEEGEGRGEVAASA